MNEITSINQQPTTEKNFLEKIKEKYEKNTVKALLLAASLLGLFNSFLTVIGIIGFFLFKDEIESKNIKEANQIIGFWAMSLLLGLCSIFFMLASTTFLMFMNIGFIYPVVAVFPLIIYFSFSAIAVLNVIKFMNDKESYYPKFMVLSFDYHRFINKLKQKAINL